MTGKKIPDAVGAMIAQAEAAAAGEAPPPPRRARSAGSDETGEPFAGFDGEVDPDAVEECAGLDHSDTDNARRLVRHFGDDLVVMQQEGSEKPPYGAWAGTHWDFGTGPARAMRIAQRLGGAIALETAFLTYTDREQAAIEAANDAGIEADVDPEDLPRGMKELAKARDKAREALRKRKERRHAHAVQSKNVARIRAMLDCAAPHMLRPADDFNPDPLSFSTPNATVHFVRTVRRVKNPAWADPDVSAEDVPEYIDAVAVRVDARPGHERSDLITSVVPVRHDARAKCPKWEAFLADFLPDAGVRRMVQTASGQGLLGLGVQLMFFHYGKGANGKSVFMETLARVLGDLSVTLPAESITGKATGSSGPSPDLARLYGRRLLRVAELPKGEPLKVELIKKLTGGERFPVRDLFKGYFDFRPLFVAHMSGNDYPKTDGTDYGTWRRLVVVKWPKTILVENQRDFEEVLAEFAPEYPGILNWLIEGAKRFIADGRIELAAESVKETKKYRDEMDPLAGFVSGCVQPTPGASVTAADMYGAYAHWASANGLTPISNTGFGKLMKSYFDRDDGRIRRYLDCALHDVPPPASGGAGDFSDHER